MKLLIRAFLIFYLLSNFNSVLAIKNPIKYGKVTQEELEMKSYAPDPSAPAVILCSYGYFDSDNFRFTHIIRVKIFKKEGYNFATRKFAVRDKADIKGKTFNLVDGEIVVDKLKNESVFRERITDNFYLVNVAMPNVKEGSIIDLQIQYSGFLANWYFQEDVPVIWSELRIEPLDYINFRKNFFGYEMLDINEKNRWVAKNVPAFQKEPFVNSRENYITKFEFDIISIDFPGYIYKNIAISWEDLSETLMERRYFGLLLKTGGFLNKAVKEIETTCKTDEEKIKAAIKFIQSNIDFNGKTRCFGSKLSLGSVQNEGIGNSADINLSLIKLLDKLDFEVYPVVLSTKENGFLSPVFPSIQRLNYVLAYVKINDDFLLVDATDELLPYYMIPAKCLNWKGRIIHEKNSKWVELKTDLKNKELIYYNLKMQDDLSLSGMLNYRKEEYAAYNFRKMFENYNSVDEYLEDLSDTYPDMEIMNADIQNIDTIYNSIIEKYEVKIKNQAHIMDSTVYLTLTLFEQMKENPFKAKERKYPVDFAYAIEKSGTIKIELPENFEIVELPESTKFVMPDNAGKFSYSVGQLNNTVILNYKLTINKTLFLLSEYGYLKAFYNEVIKKESEPLVISIK